MVINGYTPLRTVLKDSSPSKNVIISFRQECGAGAGAAGTFCSESEPEPEPVPELGYFFLDGDGAGTARTFCPEPELEPG